MQQLIIKIITFSKLKQMKHMTCVNHKQAEQVCVNLGCQAKCSYTCIEIPDTCRNQHEACSMVSLSYLLKKSNRIIEKVRNFNIQKLITFHTSAKKIIQQLSTFLDSYNMLSIIKNGLDNHGFISTKSKQTIKSFLNSPMNNNNEAQTTLNSLQKSLSSLNVDITTYLQAIRQQKNIEEQFENRREPKKKNSLIRSKIIEPSPVKSGLKQTPYSNSKIRSKLQELPGSNKEVSSSPFQLSAPKVISSLKKHVPKPPFFSKITNDAQTLSTFFYHKFNDVNLLFRASENQFSASKFHQKCNGYENTLTLVLTQGEKIIGGFTPLPWKSGGGQWYEDAKQATFLFSLTSGERYPLVNKNKAIWCSHAFGPSFGYPDLEIADKAAFHSNSCANFPQCFNNGNYIAGTGSTQMFCGSKNGHFKIKEWEVYELIF